MIVLDTNVISEMTKSRPSTSVAEWLDMQLVETLFLTSITIAEFGFGVAILPNGKRRNALRAAFAQTTDLFKGRILDFDQHAATTYAELAASARATGKGFPVPDGYIAAIAVSRGFAVATRDTAAFKAGGIAIINPWGPHP